MTAANLAGSNAGPWDAADHLASVDDMAACLEAALDEADTALFAAALGDVARAKAMSKLARGELDVKVAVAPGDEDTREAKNAFDKTLVIDASSVVALPS